MQFRKLSYSCVMLCESPTSPDAYVLVHLLNSNSFGGPNAPSRGTRSTALSRVGLTIAEMTLHIKCQRTSLAPQLVVLIWSKSHQAVSVLLTGCVRSLRCRTMTQSRTNASSQQY